MQFIGGEPQLNRDFHRLLAASKEIGFEFVEVFTNLTLLDEETVRLARSADIRFATSVYSDKPECTRPSPERSSHARTIKNLKHLIDSEVVTRAAVIQIDQETAEIESTKRFLTDLGVRHIRGRACARSGAARRSCRSDPDVGAVRSLLVGRLCVAPDGDAYPCVMARQWPVGNVLETPLARIVQAARSPRSGPRSTTRSGCPRSPPAGPRTGTPPKGSRMTTSAPTETRARVNLPRRVPAELRAGHRYTRVPAELRSAPRRV